MRPPCAPAEPEQTDNNSYTPKYCRREPLFRLDVTVDVEFRLLHLPQIQEEGRDGHEGANEDAQEGKSLYAQTEAVDLDKDDREGFEPDVEESCGLSRVS